MAATALVLGLLEPTSVLACSEATILFNFDLKIKVANDCSFENAAEMDGNESFKGGRVVDIGNGRIGQQLTSVSGCSNQEDLLFVNCSAPGSVIVGGALSPVSAGGLDTNIESIQPPNGPIALRSTTAVAEVTEIARQAGLSVRTNVDHYVSKMKRKNRFDPYCGCKLYYPDTPGANQ